MRYLRRHLTLLSHHYLSLDTSRVTALYFCIVGLDALGVVATTIKEDERREIIEWLYELQVIEDGRGGFRGGTWGAGSRYDGPHIAMTYTALAVLVTLGDDLSRVDRDAIFRELKELQQGDGSFPATRDGCERDARFAYCACVISKLLGGSAPFDVDKLTAHLRRCQGYDGGFGLTPSSEGHGGSTYCCVAALLLSGVAISDDHVVDWCARQASASEGGVRGRPNKPPDSCYSFWIGASLRALGAGDLIDPRSVTSFVLTCEHPRFGGFAKYPVDTDAPPDLLHTFYSLCWLSWAYPTHLNPINPLLGISEASAAASGIVVPGEVGARALSSSSSSSSVQ